MGHGEGAWNGGCKPRLGGDESLADAVCKRGGIRGGGLYGSGMECVDHADDGSKQAEQWGGGDKRRHEAEFMGDELCGTAAFQRRHGGEVALP